MNVVRCPKHGHLRLTQPLKQGRKMIRLVYAELSLVTGVCVACVSFWLSRVLPQSIEEGKRKRIVAGVLIALCAWLFLTGTLAQGGFLAAWGARPPRLPAIPMLALIAIITVNRAEVFQKLLDATPRHWPVAMQTFRVGVELAFWGLYACGGAPEQVTFEGRNFDVLVGLTAPFAAFAIARLNLTPGVVIVWNLLGILILSNTIVTTLSSMPGPLHLNWPGMPFTAFAAWPFVWIPAFLAPLAIFIHVFSIRQNALLLLGKNPGGASQSKRP
jgi:hypothetical protein